MNLKEYVGESARTMSGDRFSSSVKTETLHGVIGLAGEAGELLDAVKKAMFYGQTLDRKNLREELGDVMWYVAAIVRSENWNLEHILDENIQKLRIRYPDKFTKEHSEMRLDKEKV